MQISAAVRSATSAISRAPRALWATSARAAAICVYTNDRLTIEELPTS